MAHMSVLRGLPGSGKSTVAVEIQENEEGFIISRDGIRHMLFPHGKTKFEHSIEEQITKAERSMAEGLLQAGHDVIVDQTNLPHRRVREWLGLAEQVGATWSVVDLTHVDLETCLERNKNRADKVSEDSIRTMHTKYLKGKSAPTEWEPVGGTDSESGELYVAPHNKPNAVISDIDGTIALMNGRSPYDYSRVGEDSVNEVVESYLSGVLRTIENPSVIFVSGRPESARAETVKWMNRHGIVFDKLFMRSDEEHENRVRDDRVKLRLFNEHIRHNYTVHSVLDDRSRVVQMWRSLGLTVLQVAPGDF